MPDLLALAAPLPPLHIPSLIDLAKILGVPVAMFLMARFIALRDKKREKAEKVKEDAAAEETRLLKVAKETADAERAALRSDITAANLEISGLKIYIKEFDKTLDRIHKQLGLLINNYRKLS